MSTLDSMVWLSPPPVWSVEAGGAKLRLQTAAQTDFWQRTHYGFRADNGHFLHCPVEGGFALTARVSYQPLHQYDQAGLMVRFSEDCWLKTSVECEPEGEARLGAVVTNHGYSDWSTQPFAAGPASLWLRIEREGGDFRVDWSRDGESWTQLRLAHLHGASPVALAGVYACSPKAAGFSAVFDAVTLRTR